MPDESTGAVISVVTDNPAKPRFIADLQSQAADFVTFGMWDCAFCMLERNPSGPEGPILFNEAGEQDNFVGSDTHRFYVLVRDPQRSGTGVQACEWITVFGDGTPHDANQRRDSGGPPPDPRIFLVERSPGVFSSNALMLAVGDVDAGVRPKVVPTLGNRGNVDLRTHIGFDNIPLDPLRARGDSHFRVRQASMFGAVRITYPAGGTQRLTVPVFQRKPEHRRRVELQIYILRDPVTRNPAIGDIRDPKCRLWTGHIRKAREVFERAGVYVQTTVPKKLPVDFEVIEVKQASGVDQVILLNLSGPNRKPKGDEEAAIFASVVFSRLELKNSGPRPRPVLYLPFEDGSNDTGGELSKRGDFIVLNSSFLGTPKLDTLLAHELGHALMPKHGAGGHWQPPFPWLGKNDENPNHKARFDYRGNLLLSALGRELDAVDTVVDEVRLWEFPDKDGFRELIELQNNENELLFKL